MLIRIPLTEKNSTVTPVYQADGTAPVNPVFTIAGLSFNLTPSGMASYASSRYAHPVTNIDVLVPDDDHAAIASWLGNSAGGNVPAGETLTKRMTSAVTGALKQYLASASRSNLFTSPFRIGYALRLADGSHSMLSELSLLVPDSMAPVMAIREASMSGSVLRTVTEILNSPMALTVDIPPFTLPEQYAPTATHLDIIATKPASLLSGNESVAAIRTYSLFGEPVSCWYYNRMPEDIVRNAALADRYFRIIARIPISEACSGVNSLELPAFGANLGDWTSIPEFPADGITTDGRIPSHLRLVTSPLDLGNPEEYKRVRGVSLRGIFSRDTDDGQCGVTLRLLGSHHRDRWHTLATARGAHLRLLRTVCYRWLMIDADVPADAQTDALTFEVVRKKYRRRY